MFEDCIPHSRPSLSSSDTAAVSRVIESGQLSQGPVVSSFEKKLSGYIGKKQGAATSSGTAALHLALQALETKAEDEVIIPSYVCTAVLNAVLYTGAQPVIVDIDSRTYNISVDAVKKAISGRTRAIIAPHMFGCPAHIDGLKELGIPVIEDCAQAVGATIGDKKAGSTGHLSVFSFYATKVMTTGEGGMVLGDSEDLMAKIKDLRDYDNKDQYILRYNYKMTDLQASLGIEQLSRLEEFIQKRREIADRYFQAFGESSLSLPVYKEGKSHIYYRFVVETEEDASSSIQRLQNNGIMAMRPVFLPLHRFLNLSGFPQTMEAWQKGISIPLYPSLTEEEIQRIIAVVNKIF